MTSSQQRIVVAGFILDHGQVLLAKRATTKTLAPGKYHLPGGHVEFGETIKARIVGVVMVWDDKYHCLIATRSRDKIPKKVQSVSLAGTVPLESWMEVFRCFVGPAARLGLK